MRCIIVDDEALARERLRRIVEQTDGLEVCGEAANGREALLRSEALNPDLVFLDIRMPVMDGLEAARHLARLQQPPAVVFTTAYGEHALEAFEAHAVDYLLKPVRKERLAAALDKARRLTRAQLGQLQSADESARSHICARLGDHLQVISVDDIRYFQADQKYITVRAAEQRVLIEESLKSLEQEFPERFLRIHRNALVAKAYISGMAKDAEGHAVIVLDGVEERLEVSRRHAAELRKWLRES